MATDREVLRDLWDGKLPVCFVLNDEEICDLQTPEAFYLMVPRLSYFPLVWDKVRKHFIKHVHTDHQDMEMWLDYNGTPLKWHYPIGLLFDLYAYDTQLPWTLTVHFEKFPENILLHCGSRKVVESHFMSTLKEADALKHKGQVISTMQRNEHNQLWLGLQTACQPWGSVLNQYHLYYRPWHRHPKYSWQHDKFDQFWSINKKLMDTSSTDGEFKHIPFRIYCNDDGPFIQKLVRPFTEDSQPKLLQNLIEELFPDTYKTVRVITHGIELSLEVPLQWMSEHMSYPDNFLHLCIVTNSS